MKIKYGLLPHTEILSNSESESHDEFRRVLAIPASINDSDEFRRLPVSGELSAEFPAVTRLGV